MAVENAYGLYFGVVFGLPLTWVLLYCIFRFRVVEKETAMIVERWGKFHRRCDAGLHWLVPFMDVPRVLTTRNYETFLSGNIFVQNVVQRKLLRWKWRRLTSCSSFGPAGVVRSWLRGQRCCFSAARPCTPKKIDQETRSCVCFRPSIRLILLRPKY